MTAATMKAPAALSRAEVEAYLEQHRKKEVLRLLTCGSVDDGKSTLIGRLLYDSRAVYDDQLAAVTRDSARRSSGGAIDYSLLVDGLLSEREQGITIDVAYRYFTTARRKFIIADTPGHEQYTRNMATGASTADLAVILVDARYGVLPQTRRHSFIASLLGIRRAVVAVNKMDLVGWDEAVFDAIRRAYVAVAAKLDFEAIQFIPLSALLGDNVVEKSARAPWYDGPPLLEHLETSPIAAAAAAELRFPVQLVARPNLDFRGFAGTIASGTIRRGDRVKALPSGRTTTVRGIVTWGGELAEASAPEAVTITLADEIDLSRGEMLVHEGAAPREGRAIDATVVWLAERPLEQGSAYWIKHTTRLVPAEVRAVQSRIDLQTLEPVPAERLGLNDIGRVQIAVSRPLIFDRYRDNRATGAFILIDRLTNGTVGAGMIEGPGEEDLERGEGGRVTTAERARRLGQRPSVLYLVGADTEAAAAVERRLFDAGFTAAAIDEPQAALLADLGLVAVVAGAEAGLDAARAAFADRLVEVRAEAGAFADAAVLALTARGVRAL